MEERLISPVLKEDEVDLDTSLRPKYLSEFIGQSRIKEKLDIFIKAAKKRREPLDHILFSGPPGLGKTTLAQIISNEMGSNIRITSGPVLERAGDLASILTGLKEFDILFIDEIHRLNRVVEEVLYSAMEDFALDIIIGKGPAARSIRLTLPRFTLIGATTRAGLLTSPLRDRFGLAIQMDYYTVSELKEIIERSARILKVEIEDDAALEIAKRSRGTPRIANRLLRRVRDYAEVKEKGTITLEVAKKALDFLEIDEMGLDVLDRKMILTIIEKFSGGPVGIDTISAVISEEKDTIEEVYEPYLMKIGFLTRTPRGRVVTKNAYEHFGIKYMEGFWNV